MSAAMLLHVGDDVCHRIPVIERLGLVVLRSECSMTGLEDVLAGGQNFAALAFHNDLRTLNKAIVMRARALSRAPLVFFENPTFECETREFDLVVPVHTPPAVWLNELRSLIEESSRILLRSRELVRESAALRSETRTIRDMVMRNRLTAIDSKRFWQGEADSAGSSGEQPEDDDLPPGSRR